MAIGKSLVRIGVIFGLLVLMVLGLGIILQTKEETVIFPPEATPAPSPSLTPTPRVAGTFFGGMGFEEEELLPAGLKEKE